MSHPGALIICILKICYYNLILTSKVIVSCICFNNKILCVTSVCMVCLFQSWHLFFPIFLIQICLFLFKIVSYKQKPHLAIYFLFFLHILSLHYFFPDFSAGITFVILFYSSIDICYTISGYPRDL